MVHWERLVLIFAHEKLFVSYKTMLERNVGSKSSSSNKHEVVDGKNNHYKSMVMDAMIINHC